MAGRRVFPTDLHRGCVAPRADTPAETQPSCDLACRAGLGHTGEKLPAGSLSLGVGTEVLNLTAHHSLDGQLSQF